MSTTLFQSSKIQLPKSSLELLMEERKDMNTITTRYNVPESDGNSPNTDEEKQGRKHGHQLRTGGQERKCAFSHISTRAHRRTDQRTDGRTDGQSLL